MARPLQLSALLLGIALMAMPVLTTGCREGTPAKDVPSTEVAQVASARDLDFLVRLESWMLTEGVGLNYTITPRDVAVAYQDDYGVKRHEVFRSSLKPVQVDQLRALLQAMPLDSLAPEYVGDRMDGFDMTFEIQVGGKPSKKVLLHNKWQLDLVKLCEQINLMVPAKYALHIPASVSATISRGPNNSMNLTVRPVARFSVLAPPHSTSQGGAQNARPSRPAGYRGRWADKGTES